MPEPDDINTLPEDLPAPTDDGASNHLPGMEVPSLSLPSTAGRIVDIASLPGKTVLYIYPMTGRPDMELPENWNSIPGARGCTPESCAFRDLHAEFRSFGARVFGMSTQSTEYQREAVERLGLQYELLSDENLDFAEAMKLPTFGVEGMTLTKRLTLVIRGSKVEKVFYPVFPPDKHPAEVLEWLSRNAKP
ncbi:MAG: peroxiredoxin [Rubrobacter sp.]|nr:peroxiredoxin [Rubrobacter sp.]